MRSSTPVTVYFFVTSRRARSTSRDYLGRRPRPGAELGRDLPPLLHLRGQQHGPGAVPLEQDCGLRDRRLGLDLLKRLIAEGRGGILLGAHFGNFDALRLIGRGSPVAVRPLMYRAEAGTLSVLLDELDPKLKDSVIEIGTPDAMLQVRESLDRGEFVGILGDRTPADQKAIPVPFLGEEALFPTGPLTLAAALHVPVLLGYGVRTGRRRYEVGFKLFAEEIFLGRATRTEDLRHWIGLYAEWLESMCRRHPFNWFNFHDFWDKTIDSTPNR